MSARGRAYYVGPGNRFWATLHEIGLTPRRLALLCAGSDAAIGRDAFDVAGLTDRIAKHAPVLLPFDALKAVRQRLGVTAALLPSKSTSETDCPSEPAYTETVPLPSFRTLRQMT
jgi:double-stranded uracil-DNA glycosylase